MWTEPRIDTKLQREKPSSPKPGPDGDLEPDDLTESESLVFGTGFGVVTDIETAPDGNLVVVSLDQGAVYEISRR